MIQRIQTVYLLCAAIAMLITLAIPVAYLQQEAGTMVDLYISKSTPAMVLAFTSAFVSILAIALFKNRKLQMRLTLGAMALSLFTLAALCFFDFMSSSSEITDINYAALAMPAFSFVFNWLAHRGIHADEQLVRSMDRLR
jgi:hypothetical protein